MIRKINWGFISIVFVVAIALITAISVFGYTVEGDIVELGRNYLSKGGQVAGIAVERATIVVDREAGNTLSMAVDVKKGDTAFDLLTRAAGEYGLELQTKEYAGMGVLVEGIGDLIGGQDNKYWLYYMNGEMPLNSVDSQVVLPGDKIEFRFEESSF